MLRVKFLSRHDDPWLRQFPNRDGLFDGVQFLFDAATQDYDFLVVLDVMPSWRPYQTRVPRQRRILVATEPATVKRYGPARFLDQFGAILTTDAQTPHPHVILSQVGLPWHVGSFEESGRRTDHAYDLRSKSPELGSHWTGNEAAAAASSLRIWALSCGYRAGVADGATWDRFLAFAS